MELSITLIIIIVTCLVSFGGFGSQKIIDDLIFYPPAITQRNQWYRFFTCGVIHADLGHLAFNMISLYLFGDFVEKSFIINQSAQGFDTVVFGEKGKMLYLLMYVFGLFFCLLPTFAKHKNDYYYRSLGASGAVSAVISLLFLFIPCRKWG